MPLSVNFPLTSDLRTTGMTKFEFKHLEELPLSVNFPLASSPRTTGMTKFEFKHLEELSLSVNFLHHLVRGSRHD